MLAVDIQKTFDTLSDDVLLDGSQTAALLSVSVASLKLWRQQAQQGEPLRGPKPLIVAGSLVRYRTGDIRDYLRSLAEQTGVMSSRARRLATASRK